MKSLLRLAGFCLIFLFTTNALYSQSQDSIAEKIDTKFGQVIEHSQNYDIYKVIRKKVIFQLREETKTSIANLENRLAIQRDSLASKTNKIEHQQQAIEKTQNDLEEAIKDKEQLSFLGIRMLKTTYQAIVLGIIAAFILILLFLIYKHKDNRERTTNAELMLNTLQKEYDDYRKTALEKQQKLGRQLQDERNKNKKE